jgi:hypothetical protein
MNALYGESWNSELEIIITRGRSLRPNGELVCMFGLPQRGNFGT